MRIGRVALCILLAWCNLPGPSCAEDFRLLSFGVRAGGTGVNVLGNKPPQDFQAFDVVTNFGLPWERHYDSGWWIGTRLMANAGALRAAGQTAFVASLVPVVVLGEPKGRFTLDFGAGGAVLSRHRFGVQEFGGPFQFALTLGVTVPLYDRLSVGYRFQHYSDATLYGSNTMGADLHMIEFTYRF